MSCVFLSWRTYQHLFVVSHWRSWQHVLPVPNQRCNWHLSPCCSSNCFQCPRINSPWPNILYAPELAVLSDVVCVPELTELPTPVPCSPSAVKPTSAAQHYGSPGAQRSRANILADVLSVCALMVPPNILWVPQLTTLPIPVSGSPEGFRLSSCLPGHPPEGFRIRHRPPAQPSLRSCPHHCPPVQAPGFSWALPASCPHCCLLVTFWPCLPVALQTCFPLMPSSW